MNDQSQRISEELSTCLTRKKFLSDEICDLVKKIEEQDKIQQIDVLRNKKEMEAIEKENCRLQFACYEMHQLILQNSQRIKTTPLSISLTPRVSDDSLMDNDSLKLPKNNEKKSTNVSQDSYDHSSYLAGQSAGPSVASTSENSSSLGAAAMPRYKADLTFPTHCPSHDDEKENWSCSRCTFSNSGFLNECEICGSHRFLSDTSEAGTSLTGESKKPCYCHRTPG